MFAVLFPAKSFAYVLPKDLPTIEALIALHKAIKKDEDQAIRFIPKTARERMPFVVRYSHLAQCAGSFLKEKPRAKTPYYSALLSVWQRMSMAMSH